MVKVPKIVTNAAYTHYETELEKEVLSGPIPKHLAIIMDGNRRYAKEVMKDNNTQLGHKLGKDKVEDVIKWCNKLGVKILTIYAFSTENFSRDESEVKYILDLIRDKLYEIGENKETHKNKVCVKVIGERDMISKDLLDAVEYVEEATKDYSDYYLNIAVAYGGRQEIVSVMRSLAQKVKDGELDVNDITEEMISNNMYTFRNPDPDLVLRTSGELRISNFLIWQLAYSELYFTDVYWPDFRYIDLLRAIRSYQHRNRRYGT